MTPRPPPDPPPEERLFILRVRPAAPGRAWHATLRDPRTETARVFHDLADLARHLGGLPPAPDPEPDP